MPHEGRTAIYTGAGVELSQGIQESLVAILLYDDSPGGAAVAASLLPADHYDSYYRKLFQAGVDFLTRYDKPAGEHTLDIVDTLKAQNPDDADIYERLFESLEQIKDVVQRDYVFSHAGVFARYQRLRSGMANAIESLNRDTAEAVAEAEGHLRDSLDSSYELFDPGLVFSDAERALRFLDSDHGSFPTGIPELDRFDLGPARKRLHILGAGTGQGKSWWLVHLARTSILHRLRVLYVTCELSEEETSQRLCQSFFSITKRQEEVSRQNFVVKKGKLLGFAQDMLVDRPSLNDSNIHKHLTKKLGGFKKRPKLVVKEFPTGALTIPKLKSYLSSLEGVGFLPDIILVDYPDEFDINAANLRLETIKVYTDLRGIAVERNVAVACVTQLSDEGSRARTATKSHLAEAKGKAHKADVLLTYSQTQDEFELGLARIFVAKGRSDRDKFSVLISQAYAIGQFVVDSARMSHTYWDHVQGIDTEDEDEE